MKRCSHCGYAHLEAGGANLSEMCDGCGVALDTSSRIDGLVQLQNVSLRLAQRITCDEEERQRFGYNLVSAYRFPEVNGRLDRRDAEVLCDGVPVLTLGYGDATDLWRVNLGWTHQDGSQPRGFNLDVERGYWSRNQADASDSDDAASEGRVMRVVPFVRDTKNALVMRFEPPRSGSETNWCSRLNASVQMKTSRSRATLLRNARELSCDRIRRYYLRGGRIHGARTSPFRGASSWCRFRRPDCYRILCTRGFGVSVQFLLQEKTRELSPTMVSTCRFSNRNFERMCLIGCALHAANPKRSDNEQDRCNTVR